MEHSVGVGGLLIRELREPLYSPGPERSGVSADRCLTRLLDARDSTVQRRDEFVQFMHELTGAYRHVRTRLRAP